LILTLNMKTPVSACVHSCTDSFKALSGAISSASKTYQNQAVSAALEDHLGRFRVWCGNTGAQQTGNTSLDYRLRESEHAQQGMQRLLRNLDTLLAEGRVFSRIRDNYLVWSKGSGSITVATLCAASLFPYKRDKKSTQGRLNCWLNFEIEL